MKMWKGTAASGGVALGTAVHVERMGLSSAPALVLVDNPEAEIRRFHRGRLEALKEIDDLYHLARRDMGQEEADIFFAHKAMVEDQELIGDVENKIRSLRFNAEYAVYESIRTYEAALSAIEDEYLRERAADLRDISQRLIQKLDGGRGQAMIQPEDGVVLAEDLLPSQTIQMDKSRVRAFLTQKGSPNSHAAILARTREIPAVVAMGAGLDTIPDGTLLLVDGDTGTVYANPDSDMLAWYHRKKAEQDSQRAALHLGLGRENRTLDGRLVQVKANIGAMEDVEEALQNGCDGVGLTRSEFLYMHSLSWPDEETQFTYYRQVLEAMEGRQVIIRTCDLGMDKKTGYWQGAQEENPALGVRGIRLSLARPEMFLTQLRALLRASPWGSLGVMLPMVSSAWELDRALELYREAREQLESEGAPVSDYVKLGIMIETPAAAVLSDLLARKVDFFSIGTNDLVQYTLCADRANPSVAELYDPCHPAVLRLIRTVIKNIHREGKPCSICGDAATNPEFACQVMAMGVDSLSVPPSQIPKLRHLVQETDCSEVKPLWPEE